MKEIAVFYVGIHSQGEYLSDVPPRDLTLAEANNCGGVELLVASGFYVEPEKVAEPIVETESKKKK